MDEIKELAAALFLGSLVLCTKDDAENILEFLAVDKGSMTIEHLKVPHMPDCVALRRIS